MKVLGIKIKLLTLKLNWVVLYFSFFHICCLTGSALWNYQTMLKQYLKRIYWSSTTNIFCHSLSGNIAIIVVEETWLGGKLLLPKREKAYHQSAMRYQPSILFFLFGICIWIKVKHWNICLNLLLGNESKKNCIHIIIWFLENWLVEMRKLCSLTG